MIIALASPCIASTLDEGLDKIKRFLAEASAQGVPGYRPRVAFVMAAYNEEKIIRGIPEDKEILFLPDMFLGAYLQKAGFAKLAIRGDALDRIVVRELGRRDGAARRR